MSDPIHVKETRATGYETHDVAYTYAELLDIERDHWYDRVGDEDCVRPLVLRCQGLEVDLAAAREELAVAVAREDNKRLGDLYGELLYAVINKYPGESRHQTALRFIQQAERGNDSACAGGPQAKGAKKECAT